MPKGLQCVTLIMKSRKSPGFLGTCESLFCYYTNYVATYIICCRATYKECPFNIIGVSFIRISEFPNGTFSLGCVWLACLPETDMGGQVAAVIGAALRDEAAGVTAAAIGERIGGVRVALYCNIQLIVRFCLVKCFALSYMILCNIASSPGPFS